MDPRKKSFATELAYATEASACVANMGDFGWARLAEAVCWFRGRRAGGDRWRGGRRRREATRCTRASGADGWHRTAGTRGSALLHRVRGRRSGRRRYRAGRAFRSAGRPGWAVWCALGQGSGCRASIRPRGVRGLCHHARSPEPTYPGRRALRGQDRRSAHSLRLEIHPRRLWGWLVRSMRTKDPTALDPSCPPKYIPARLSEVLGARRRRSR